MRAYLQKHPSTIPATLVLDKAHEENWIKDEMERRLWLCEKWFLHLQMGKVNLDETLDAVVKSMGVFLDYREKYYGIRSKEEKLTLLTYLNQREEPPSSRDYPLTRPGGRSTKVDPSACRKHCELWDDERGFLS